MDFENLVLVRRSVRSYKKTKVTEYDLKEIISCAQEAPSWKNSQTARYYAAVSESALEEVRSCLPEFNQESVKNCGALVVTTFVKNRSGFGRDGVADNELGNEWGAYDLGLASTLLLLKAKEMGLNTLIMGLRDSEKLREVLAIPENEEVVSVIAIGESDAIPERPKRKDIDSILKFY